MDIAPSADALRAAIENEPQKAELRYLLGAELAQQRDYDGAVLEMSRALELERSLHSCRFQLGLLLLTMGMPDRARAVWGDLESLGSESALWHFKQGLEALIDDQFSACARWLQAGIELNDSNPALNRDMQLVIDRAIAALEQAPPASSGQPAADDASASVRTDFSLYGPDRD